MLTEAWEIAAWFAVLQVTLTVAACYVAFLQGKLAVAREQRAERARLRRSYRRASDRIMTIRTKREPLVRKCESRDRVEIIGLNGAITANHESKGER